MQTLLYATDPALGDAVAQALHQHGHAVCTHDGDAPAWASYCAHRQPLVVLAQADASSLALCGRIRASESGEHATILIVVEHEAQDRLPEIIEAGADDYVLAPLKMERLVARLDFAAQKSHGKVRRQQVEAELEARLRQQAIVAALGQRALAAADLDDLMGYAVHAIAEALGVPFCKVLALQPGEDVFVLKAGTGWAEGVVGRARLATGRGSQAGYTLLANEPVVVLDLATETRFSGPTLLHDHGIRSGMSVVIAGPQGPYGVLGAHTPERRPFTMDDVNFLQSTANVLAAALERQHTEQALRASEARAQRLAMVASNTTNAVVITDAQRRIEWVNEGFTRMTGYTLDEVLGQTPAFMLQDDGASGETVRYVRTPLSQGTGFTAERMDYHKQGTAYWVRVEVQPLQDGAGTLTGYMAIETDITESRRAEDALRESEAKARAIVETTVDGIITIDVAGRIESFNPAAERIFGYTEAEVLGKNVKVLMPPPYYEEHDGYMRSYRETGRRKIIGIGREVYGQRKDDSTFPMELAVSEVRLNGRRIFTGIVRDITERRRLEQEILEISEQERRRIGQDLHDGLGQMLTGIGLIAQNLTRRLNAETHPAAEAAGEITDLVKDADQAARGLARGLVPVELDAHGLSTALERLVHNAQRLFGITCMYEEVGRVRFYDNTTATHLYRIAQEAVSNAVKHGHAGRIAITLAAGEDQVRLRVHDDGTGFPDVLPDQRGMGVRIMHYRAHIAGGRLDIRPDPAGGTVVTCTVPRAGHLQIDPPPASRTTRRNAKP